VLYGPCLKYQKKKVLGQTLVEFIK
jgi:hypothetical protein